MAKTLCKTVEEFVEFPGSAGSGMWSIPGDFRLSAVPHDFGNRPSAPTRSDKLSALRRNDLTVSSAELLELDLAMMGQALALAREASLLGEVPVGSLVVRDGRILAQAFNLRETWNDPTAHAERVALTLAGRALGTWRLDGCTLYVTLEPCPMCAGAIVQSRIARVVYGAADPKAGACDTLYQIVSDPRLNHRALVTGGILKDECGALLTSFFQARRPLRTATLPPEGCLSG